MTQGTILHLFGWDKKFVLPFRNMIHEHFADGRHQFIIYGEVEQDAIPPTGDTVIYRSLLKNFFALSKALYQAEKIILHGLFSSHLMYIFALQPWLLKKCYWVIWGGDLYVHEAEIKDWRWKKNEFVRRLVIPHFGHFVTYIKGEYDLVQKWYGAIGAIYECFTYPSNVYRDFDIKFKEHATINIQVGNSASITNHHFETLEKLSVYKDQNIKLFVPLSYGDREYAKKVITYGKSVFGDKFIPMLDFMPFDEYLKFLAEVDIAIFNHSRQQAMGNTITLLGLGKKVFMRTEITSWKTLQELGLHVFSIEDLDIVPLSTEQAAENRKVISWYFSEANLVAQLRCVFGQ